MAFGEYAGQPTEAVTAEQLDEDRSIITPRGVVEGHAGDWEVRSPDGNVQKMSDEEWQAAQGNDNGSPSDEESEVKTEDTGEETDSEEDSETPEESPPDSSPKRAEKSKGKF